ncbi:hypothetical protein N431DRAFT_485268 [Stipitochalara longipes BDJ]|nr:hypothetical protein N431DRAFT_485268 [Stipitochalara longipes BDJ]
MASPTSLSQDEFRLLTWPRPQLSRMTIQPESLEKYCPLDNDQLRHHTMFNASIASSTSLPSIGSLKILPPEILHSIFNMLDLKSLTDFRAISWQARALVDSLQPYNAIIQHCPDALRALLSTHMAVHFTAQDIFKALCAEACSGCGQFGPFLDMFTAHRYCITCVIYSDDLLSMTTAAAKTKLGLNAKMMRRLPTLLSVPGQYTESERMYQRRMSLVRVMAVSAARSTQQHDLKALHRRTRPPRPPPPPPPPIPTTPFVPNLLRRSDRHGQNPYRFMAMLRFPSLDRQTGNLDWGVSCQACRLGPRDKRRGYCDWNTVYSAPGYMEHFQKCELSRKGKAEIPRYAGHASGDETISSARFLAFLSNFKF